MIATAIENKYRGKFCNLVGAELLRRATPFADPGTDKSQKGAF